MLHVEPVHIAVINYPCVYCKSCDLLIVHKHEIESKLKEMYSAAPEIIGNKYSFIGTVEGRFFRKSPQPVIIEEMMRHISYFLEEYEELRTVRPGWYRGDREPPVTVPPPPKDWLRM